MPIVDIAGHESTGVNGLREIVATLYRVKMAELEGRK